MRLRDTLVLGIEEETREGGKEGRITRYCTVGTTTTLLTYYSDPTTPLGRPVCCTTCSLHVVMRRSSSQLPSSSSVLLFFRLTLQQTPTTQRQDSNRIYSHALTSKRELHFHLKLNSCRCCERLRNKFVKHGTDGDMVGGSSGVEWGGVAAQQAAVRADIYWPRIGRVAETPGPYGFSLPCPGPASAQRLVFEDDHPRNSVLPS